MRVLLKALNVKVIVILPKKKGLKIKIFFWMFFTIFFFIFFIFFFFGLFFRWYKVLKNYVNEWLVGCLVLRHQNFNFLFISTICLPSCVKIVYNLRRHFYFYFFFELDGREVFFVIKGWNVFRKTFSKRKSYEIFLKFVSRRRAAVKKKTMMDTPRFAAILFFVFLLQNEFSS